MIEPLSKMRVTPGAVANLVTADRGSKAFLGESRIEK
jgi:hypothetical protein